VFEGGKIQILHCQAASPNQSRVYKLRDLNTVDMTAQENVPTQTLSYQSLEILLIVSVTVNFCVSWSVILPKMCRTVLRDFGRKRLQEIDEQASEMPSFCRRL